MEQLQRTKKKIKYTSDWTLWACYIILCAISVVEVFSASSLELKKGSVYLPIASHFMFLGMGFVAMFLIEHLHYKYTKLLSILFAVGAFIFALITPFVGVEINGAKRSIDIGIMLVQAAEPCKVALAMFLAFLMSIMQKEDNSGLTWKGVLWSFLTIISFVAVLISQGGSNALLVLLVGVTMMLIGGLPKPLFWGGIISVIAAIVVVIVLISAPSKEIPQDVPQTARKEVVEENDKFFKKIFGRFSTWSKRIEDWKPGGIPEYEKPTTDENSQKHHAYMAVANGKGIGVMPGNSRECSRLQLAFSDFIYAIILEELGLLGGIIVLLCYLGIVIRACMISKKCKSPYARFLIVGMALVISYQAFYHMCISVGLLPVSGQPLPFISKGGTSILFMSIAMGLMLSVSRYAVERTDMGLKTIDEDDELPNDLKAENPAGGF